MRISPLDIRQQQFTVKWVRGFDIHEVDDGLVVYDATTDRVHYLNATASLVLSLCDGRRTPEQLAALVGAAWRLADPPRAEVNGCIARLRSEAVIR